MNKTARSYKLKVCFVVTIIALRVHSANEINKSKDVNNSACTQRFACVYWGLKAALRQFPWMDLDRKPLAVRRARSTVFCADRKRRPQRGPYTSRGDTMQAAVRYPHCHEGAAAGGDALAVECSPRRGRRRAACPAGGGGQSTMTHPRRSAGKRSTWVNQNLPQTR